MAREDRPYLPWYYKDWLTSPDRFSMTYEQRGVYRDLLDFAWDQRGLPTDTETIRAMLALDKRPFALLWPAVSKHFIEKDGRLVNSKQERVRTDMDDYRLKKQTAGKKGGRPKAEEKQTDNQKETKEVTKEEAKQKPSLALALSDPSVPSDLSTTTSSPSVDSSPSSPLVMSPLRFDKLRQSHAFIGSRLRVPNVLHDELRTKLGGDNPTVRLLDWYYVLNAEVEQSGEPILDVFVWLRPKFIEWAEEAAYQAALAKVRP